MNFTLYLPDKIGARAKEAELPLSRILREGVIRELERKERFPIELKESWLRDYGKPEAPEFRSRKDGNGD